MPARQLNDQVLVADDHIVRVRTTDVAHLKHMARTNGRGRARLCAHKSSQDPLHEMLIVLDESTYVPPHRHAGKSESFHVIEGSLDVVVFTEDGEIEEVIPMGVPESGRHFYYRLAHNAYHAVLPRTAQVVIHETTNGPFQASDTEFAPWAPSESELAAARGYVAELKQRVKRFAA